MRKLVLSGLLALGLSLVSAHQAAAWINFKFSAGVNWHWQSGNNNYLWGAFRDGQVPGPEALHPGGAPPGAFPYFGSGPAPARAPGSTPTSTPASTPAHQTNWGHGNPYSTTGYNPAYSTHPQPLTFGHPGYWGYHSAPSYWYRR